MGSYSWYLLGGL